jgi:hypothetical protein
MLFLAWTCNKYFRREPVVPELSSADQADSRSNSQN